MRRLFLIISIFVISICVSAQKPRWVGNTPKELNNTYRFVEIVSYGEGIESARMDAIHLLAQNQNLSTAAKVSVETGKLTHISQETVNGEMNEHITEQFDISVNISGQDYKVQASPVDEFVAGYENGRIKLHTLYMVAVSDNPIFDRTYLTTSYGLAPVLMSIVPGVGQWYKGNRGKGICMFAAEALSVTGIILAESNRVSYEHKMLEQPKFATEYNTRRNNWTMGRNVCIGLAAGVWIWGIVDAAVAKGARQVLVSPTYGGGLSVTPNILPTEIGFSLAYRF